MNDMERFENPLHGLSEILRQAKEQMTTPLKKSNAGRQQKVTKIRQPDGTTIEIFEETTIIDLEFQ